MKPLAEEIPQLTDYYLLSSSVQTGIYALGKAHLRSTPSLRCFTSVAFETVLMLVWLTMTCSRPSNVARRKLPLSPLFLGAGDVAQLVERRTGTPLRPVRFPGEANDFYFFSRSQFSVQTFLRVSVHPPCAIACMNVCAHVKDPVVYVRVPWIMETLKHPACTVGWVARLCRSWLSPGKKASRISRGRKSIRTIQL